MLLLDVPSGGLSAAAERARASSFLVQEGTKKFKLQTQLRVELERSHSNVLEIMQYLGDCSNCPVTAWAMDRHDRLRTNCRRDHAHTGGGQLLRSQTVIALGL